MKRFRWIRLATLAVALPCPGAAPGGNAVEITAGGLVRRATWTRGEGGAE